ncbi:uncharacterized protein LOC120515759 isoform X2 [Polypterus senegalus]|uniref:uncharacterized protein LOC120515759 isoform X2 n=1 Tax=Polypterus senegalus TaxID=55291 RepID=UPI001965E986|nr:uncharacterized protein LOC120515759 isoform X2 [Polypterus senegalus]
MRNVTFCGSLVMEQHTRLPDPSFFQSWNDLVKATIQDLHGAADGNSSAYSSAETWRETEVELLRRAQQSNFPVEVKNLQSGVEIPLSSRLRTLSPEFDHTLGLIRVGGRLRRIEGFNEEGIHPIVLDPSHPITKLLIQNYDEKLLHPGPERVFAEVRRKYWILRGREAIRRHQHQCRECQRWRATTQAPKMADLPPARLRLFKPPFWSTGVDCFGPFTVKIGRRTEKRWGIIFKCMTTRCVHLDLIENLDTDAFLMAFRRFVSRRGQPAELLSDRGTNFRGGEAELKEAITAMAPSLQEQLAKQQVKFQFNPPSSPHFGGTWEREIRCGRS